MEMSRHTNLLNTLPIWLILQGVATTTGGKQEIRLGYMDTTVGMYERGPAIVKSVQDFQAEGNLKDYNIRLVNYGTFFFVFLKTLRWS